MNSKLETATETDSPPMAMVQTQLEPLVSTAYKQKRLWFCCAVALQITLMLGSAVPAAVTLSSGKIVRLKTTPVDPYDMFRGDYVRLGYEMSTTPVNSAVADDDLIYVTLWQDGEYWRPRLASRIKPKLKAGEILLKGKYRHSRILFGIEQVFVPEKTGRTAEASKYLTVDAAVDTDGNARINKVLNADTTIYDANKVIFGN